MNILEAIVFGVVQGVTEFLPVSSSGHQVLLEHLLGVATPSLELGILLHVATACSLIAQFYHKILAIRLQTLMKIVVSSIPVVIVGLFLYDTVAYLFQSVRVAAAALLITGFFNLRIYHLLKHRGVAQKPKATDPSWMQSVHIGLQQVLAVIPGISRSATTLRAALGAGMSREPALEYIFLLFFPLVFGATALQVRDISDFMVTPQMMLSACVAFVVGYVSIGYLKNGMHKPKVFMYFAIYCFCVGALALAARLLLA